MILCDAGPLIALADDKDQHHHQCLAAFRRLNEPLGTIWPAIAEAMFILSGKLDCQDYVWKMLERGVPHLLRLDLEDLPRIRELIHKYADLPMDLADAALIRVAERDAIQTIFTVDKKDFQVYRLYGRIRPTLIP